MRPRPGAGQIQVGSLTAFLQYLLQIRTAVMMGTFMVMMVPRAMVCAERITEVLRTGSGRSTPLHLVPRLLDPAGGAVELDGVPLPRPSHEQVAARVALVPQRPHLLSGTAASGARLRAALVPATRHATVLVVAQRVSTVRDADQILVLGRDMPAGASREEVTRALRDRGGQNLADMVSAADVVPGGCSRSCGARPARSAGTSRTFSPATS